MWILEGDWVEAYPIIEFCRDLISSFAAGDFLSSESLAFVSDVPSIIIWPLLIAEVARETAWADPFLDLGSPIAFPEL